LGWLGGNDPADRIAVAAVKIFGQARALRAAHEEANAFIKREPKAAAEIYLKLTKDKKNSADDLVAMITDPDIEYTTTPANLMKHVEFMYRVGRLKHLPASWKDLFFAEAHDLNGT
jgi:NitT/TauT family transport system substrate-binding protein